MRFLTKWNSIRFQIKRFNHKFNNKKNKKWFLVVDISSPTKTNNVSKKRIKLKEAINFDAAERFSLKNQELNPVVDISRAKNIDIICIDNINTFRSKNRTPKNGLINVKSVKIRDVEHGLCFTEYSNIPVNVKAETENEKQSIFHTEAFFHQTKLQKEMVKSINPMKEYKAKKNRWTTY